MNAPELYELCSSLGEKILKPKGFVDYGRGCWAYQSSKYILAFELANNNKRQHFNIKYLTLVFYDYVKRSDVVALTPGKYVDRSGPIQINPFKLPKFIKSGFSEHDWHYVNVYTCKGVSNAYQPLYYGGIQKQSFFSKFAIKKNVKLKVKYPQSFIESMGVEVITEKQADKSLEIAMRNIAEFSFLWADQLTPQSIIKQIETHGDDWFEEKEWIKAYKIHLDPKKWEMEHFTLLKANPPKPPWITHPKSDPSAQFWKIGGQRLIEDIYIYLRNISATERDQYLDKYKEPIEWLGFYLKKT
jgi:hypothetical protein